MRFLTVAALVFSTLLAGPLAAQEQPEERADTGHGAVLRGLDKVNGQTRDIELRNGASSEFFGLMVTLGECRYPADNPTGDAFAFLTIRDVDSGRIRFEGWMIASSPALNALDHNRYDISVIRCMTE